MKNFKFITIVVLLQTAYCTATISVQFEKIPDGPPPPQNNNNNNNNVQSAPSQTQPQFSSSNFQQAYIPPGNNYNIQQSVYNTPNNYQSNIIPPLYNQPGPQSSGGHYTGGQYFQPTSNNPIQYPYQQQQQQQQQNYQQQQPQQQQQRPVASGSGQHPFAHPNSLGGGDGKPPGRPVGSSFMSLLLGSMGLHGLTNTIFGRRGPPRGPRPNNNQQQQKQQQQQQQNKPTSYVQQDQHIQSAASPSAHFGNHQSAVQNYAQQQHYQVSHHYQHQPQPQQQSNYQQSSQPVSSHSVNNVDNVVIKPEEYILSTTQSYYDPSSSSNHHHSHSSSSSSNHGQGSRYEPQYQSSVSHVISGPGGLKYEEPPVTTYREEEASHIKPYTIIEKPVVHYIEKPVVRFVEKTVVRTVEKPVVRVVEKPVIKYIHEKPGRGFLGKQGDPYVAQSSSFGEEEEGDNEEVHVIHHNYPPSSNTPTQHQAEEESEYYTGSDGTYFRKGSESSHKTASSKNTEPAEDNAFKQIVQIPKEMPGYRVIQTHTYGPHVSGEGLKFAESSVGKLGESETDRADKKSVKMTEQFLS